jgi:hypothetical protein
VGQDDNGLEVSRNDIDGEETRKAEDEDKDESLNVECFNYRAMQHRVQLAFEYQIKKKEEEKQQKRQKAKPKSTKRAKLSPIL